MADDVEAEDAGRAQRHEEEEEAHRARHCSPLSARPPPLKRRRRRRRVPVRLLRMNGAHCARLVISVVCT